MHFENSPTHMTLSQRTLAKDSPDTQSPHQHVISPSSQAISNTIHLLCENLKDELQEMATVYSESTFEKGLSSLVKHLLVQSRRHFERQGNNKELMDQTKHTIEQYAQKKQKRICNSQQVNRQLQEINMLLDKRQRGNKRFGKENNAKGFNFTFSNQLLMEGKENQVRLHKQKPVMTFSQYKKML